MLLITCPYCEAARPELEFVYGGEAHIARPSDPTALSDEQWRDHLYIRSNARGLHAAEVREANPVRPRRPARVRPLT